MARNGFVLYHGDYDKLDMLSGDELRELFDALRRYSETGELPCVSGAVAMAFSFMRASVDRDDDRYKKRVTAGKNAANTRWSNQSSDASACERIPTHANECDSMRLDASNANTNTNPKTNTIKNAVVGAPAREDDHNDGLSLTLTEKIPGIRPADWQSVISFQEDGMPDDVIQYAADIAVKQGKPNFGFMRYLLNAWFQNDIKTLDAAKEYERQKFDLGGRHALARAAPDYIPPSQRHFFPD